MSERRQSARVPVRLAATYRSASRAMPGTVTDLSRHGLCFAGDAIEQVGTVAEIEVVLPDRHLVLRGQVARHMNGDAGVGFRFDELADHARRQIANLLLSAHSIRKFGAS
jgi:hypothetical protein